MKHCISCLIYYVPNADKHGYFGPFDKNRARPKTRQKESFFRSYMWYRTEFDLNVLFIHLHTRKILFNALVFTLRSKVELNWTRAIRPVIAQSVQFSKIAKKLNIDLCQFFFSSKGSTVLIKTMK